MKSGLLDMSMKAQQVLVPVDRRHHTARAPMSCRVTYSYEEGITYITEGLLRDVSEIGCGIRGKTPPAVGSRITLTLYLLDRKPPLCVINASVTWVAGDFFGVTFPTLTPNECARVRRHMECLVSVAM